MKVEAVEVRQVSIPMVEPLSSAHGDITHRESVLVRVMTDVGEGWGECVALDTDTYRPETTNGEYEYLTKVLAPTFRSGDDVEDLPHNTGKAAVEMALLDASLRAAKKSLARHLGAKVLRVPVIGVAGLVEGSELLEAVERLVKLGFTKLKVKIAPGRDIERIALINRHFPGAVTRVDANGSYSWSNAVHRSALRELDALELELIEQPLPVAEATSFAEVRYEMTTDIALDESIDSVESALTAVERKRCDVLMIKPGTLGGCRAAKRIIDTGARVAVGGMIETAIGRSANLAVASLSSDPLAAEIAPDGRWFSHSLVYERTALKNGCVDVPDMPGLGVHVDIDAIARHTLRVSTLRST